MLLKPWQIMTLIILQLSFAACAASVLLYNAMEWAPEVIDFEWLSYRAFNIYVSLAIIGYLVWGLPRQHRYILLLLAAFSFFHLIEGVIIAFWTKAVIHLATLVVLGWGVYGSITASPGGGALRASTIMDALAGRRTMKATHGHPATRIARAGQGKGLP